VGNTWEMSGVDMRIPLTPFSQKCGENIDWIHLDPWLTDVNRTTNALLSKNMDISSVDYSL